MAWCRSTIVGVVPGRAVPLRSATLSDREPMMLPGRASTSSHPHAGPLSKDGRRAGRGATAPSRPAWKTDRVSDAPFSAEFSRGPSWLALYAADEPRGRRPSAGFAVLAIIIACLGLFGLAAFTAERRTKEIGIRKVLGARIRDIVGLLAWQFSKPVIIAMPIAWAASWWAMKTWLDTFDTRIDLGPLPFVAAGLIALVIAIGTIASHAFKVARANPILALRYE